MTLHVWAQQRGRGLHGIQPCSCWTPARPGWPEGPHTCQRLQPRPRLWHPSAGGEEKPWKINFMRSLKSWVQVLALLPPSAGGPTRQDGDRPPSVAWLTLGRGTKDVRRACSMSRAQATCGPRLGLGSVVPSIACAESCPGRVTSKSKWWPLASRTQSLTARGLRGRQVDGCSEPRERHLTQWPGGQQKTEIHTQRPRPRQG